MSIWGASVSFQGGGVIPDPITVDVNWGTDSVVHPSNKQSTVTGTLTVPGTNSGGIDITFTNSAGGTPQYNQNAMGVTTLVTGTNFAVSNGDTWVFRLQAPSGAGTFTVTVTDHKNGTVIGTWTLTVT